METELAYLAGIVDGEGSVELKIQRTGTMDLLLHIYNSDKPLFDWIVEHFGGRLYEIHRKATTLRPQWQPVYNWNIGGQQARDLLERLLPYMLVKPAQARLAIEAWDARQPTPRNSGKFRGRARPSDEILAMRESYVHQMHLLNRKNRGDSLNTCKCVVSV